MSFAVLSHFQDVTILYVNANFIRFSVKTYVWKKFAESVSLHVQKRCTVMYAHSHSKREIAGTPLQILCHAYIITKYIWFICYLLEVFHLCIMVIIYFHQIITIVWDEFVIVKRTISWLLQEWNDTWWHCSV